VLPGLLFVETLPFALQVRVGVPRREACDLRQVLQAAPERAAHHFTCAPPPPPRSFVAFSMVMPRRGRLAAGANLAVLALDLRVDVLKFVQGTQLDIHMLKITRTAA
jgi:hypothetical protein